VQRLLPPRAIQLFLKVALLELFCRRRMGFLVKSFNFSRQCDRQEVFHNHKRAYHRANADS